MTMRRRTPVDQGSAIESWKWSSAVAPLMGFAGTGFLLLAIVVGCSYRPPSERCPQPANDNPECSAVEGAVLDTVFRLLRAPASHGPVVIRQEPNSWLPKNDALLPGMRQGLAQKLPSLRDETFSSFVSRNRRPCTLALTTLGGARIHFISTAEHCTIFSRGDGWNEFHRRFPGASGFEEYSLPGFSPDSTQMLVYWGSWRGPESGIGYYYLLERRASGWQIVGHSMAWVS
jgi:hypothetical protein